MTQYVVEKLENGIATIRYFDGSWAEVVLSSDMTQEDLDDLAHQFAPKAGAAPKFLFKGYTSKAKAKTVSVEDNPETAPTWLQNRMSAYGDPMSQIEYITENGLEAWQAHVAEIKKKYPEE